MTDVVTEMVASLDIDLGIIPYRNSRIRAFGITVYSTTDSSPCYIVIAFSCSVCINSCVVYGNGSATGCTCSTYSWSIRIIIIITSIGIYSYIADGYVATIGRSSSRTANCRISTYAIASISASCCQHILLATPRYGHAAVFYHINARAIVGRYIVVAQHMDGGTAAFDADGITAVYIDVGIFQVDVRLAAGDCDGMPEVAAHPIMPVTADCSVLLGDIRHRFTYGQVDGVHRGSFQHGGEAVIDCGCLVVYLDKVIEVYRARHHVGFVGRGIHLVHGYPVLRCALDAYRALVVGAGGVAEDFHRLHLPGLRAAELHAHLGELVGKGEADGLVIRGSDGVGFQQVGQSFCALLGEVYRFIHGMPGIDLLRRGAFPAEGIVAVPRSVGIGIGIDGLLVAQADHDFVIVLPLRAVAFVRQARPGLSVGADGDGGYLEGVGVGRERDARRGGGGVVVRAGRQEEKGQHGAQKKVLRVNAS